MVSGDVGDHILNVLQLVAMVLKQEQGNATIQLLPEEAVVALEKWRKQKPVMLVTVQVSA